MKQHAIIEKTARFISSQGVQMEILLKAKQSNNFQFEFLTQNSALYPYYKFILDAIKGGTYPLDEILKDNNTNDVLCKDQQGVSTKNSLEEPFAVASINKPVITVPTIKYKPSASCAYTQLISKIKGVPLPEVIDEHRRSFAADNTDATENSATVKASDASTTDIENFTPVLLQYNGQTYITEDNVELSNLKNGSTTCKSSTVNSPPKVEILKNSSALRLAQNYSSDSGSESESEGRLKPAPPTPPPPKLTFPIPPENLRNIIDKTASYVIKNGRQFEETLRSKSEERFTFLLPDNEYYPYYMYKITGDPDAASIEQKTRRAAAVAAALMSKKKLLQSNSGAHVSFSIKPKEDQLQPALPQEASDDEEEYSGQDKQHSTMPLYGDAHQRTVPEHVKKAIQLVESQLMARNAQLAAVVGTASGAIMPNTMQTAMRSRFDLDYNGRLVKPSGSSMNSTACNISNAELERNALYEQQQTNRHKELKRAEEKVKDKLAQIAREKLGGLISKEKQLQLERKRKAMAFLNQIKGTSENELTPDKKQAMDDGNASDNSEISVHSIPITSYGPDDKTDDEELQAPPLPPFPRILNTPAARTPSSRSKSEINNRLKPTEEVTLSDDDDVQLISETKPQHTSRAVLSVQKRRSKLSHRQRRSSSHSRSQMYDLHSQTKRVHRTQESSVSSDESPEISTHRVKKHSHKSSKVKKSARKNHAKSKNKSKSKKRARSQSRSSYSSEISPYRSRSKSHVSHHSISTFRKSHSFYSRSGSEESVASPIASSKRYHQHGKESERSHTQKRKEKRRRKHDHH